MKVITLAVTLTSFLPLALANPLPTEIFGLEERAGPYCHATLSDTPCRYGAGYSYNIKRYVQPSQNAGGTCKAYDIPHNTWIWIQGWHCWMMAQTVNSACVGQQPWCASGSGQCPTHDC